MKSYYWSFNEENDIWRNRADSIEDCIEEAREEVRQDELITNAIFIGESMDHSPSIFVEGLIEELQERAYDECGECSEDWLEWVPVSLYEKLGDALNEVLHTWLKEIGEMPTFGTVENIKMYNLVTKELIK